MLIILKFKTYFIIFFKKNNFFEKHITYMHYWLIKEKINPFLLKFHKLLYGPRKNEWTGFQIAHKPIIGLLLLVHKGNFTSKMIFWEFLLQIVIKRVISLYFYRLTFFTLLLLDYFSFPSPLCLEIFIKTSI